MSASPEWFVRRGRDVRGPLSAGRLREYARNGQIRPDDHVRQGVNGAWCEAASVRGLFAAAAHPPPPPSVDATTAAGGQFAARAVQPSPGGASPRRKKKRRKRTAFWIALALAAGVVSLSGAGMILSERGAFSFDFGGGSEASARSALSAELDKWMARQDHEAKHIELLMAVLLDYSIQSLQPVKTEHTDVPYEDWDRYRAADGTYKGLPPTYLATVRVNVESQAGTALPRVVLYRLTRNPKARKWRIWGTMTGK